MRCNDYEITIATMECSGRKTDYGYTSPIKVSITPSDDDPITHTISNLCGDLVLEFALKYREASTYIDIPIFKINIYDINDQLLDSLESTYAITGIRWN